MIIQDINIVLEVAKAWSFIITLAACWLDYTIYNLTYLTGLVDDDVVPVFAEVFEGIR